MTARQNDIFERKGKITLCNLVNNNGNLAAIVAQPNGLLQVSYFFIVCLFIYIIFVLYSIIDSFDKSRNMMLVVLITNALC